MKDQRPLVSIVTVCYNSEKTIERTIKSVLSQSYKNIEFIIIDGQSTDNTKLIVKKYKKKIKKFISEKDKGIYDAFNKGLKIFNGDVIGFVNSDDFLKPNAIKILVKYYNKYPNKDFFFGAVKKDWEISYGYNPWKIYFSWGFFTSHSPGFFIKKKAAKIVGLYNTKYRYSSDFDYFYRMIVKKKLTGIGTNKNEIFGVFSKGGLSSRISFKEHLLECTKIRIDNNQNKFMVILTVILKLIKRLISYVY